MAVAHETGRAGAAPTGPRGRLAAAGLGRRVWSAAGDWAPIVPFFLLAGGLLLGSAVWLVRSSVEGVDGGWSLQAWRDVTGSGLGREAITTSLRLSAWVASICAVLGTVLAYYVANLARRGRTTAQALLNVAANFGGASLAIAMISTYGAVGFARLLLADWLGWEMGLDLYGFWGLALTYTYFTLPLFVLLILPAMAALRPEWWEAVRAASGTRWHYWRHVGLPVLFPFVLSGWVLTFAWSIGQFSVPFALLGSQPSTQLITVRLGNYLFSATGGTYRFQSAAALAVLLIAVTGLALLIYRTVARRVLARLEGA